MSRIFSLGLVVISAFLKFTDAWLDISPELHIANHENAVWLLLIAIWGLLFLKKPEIK